MDAATRFDPANEDADRSPQEAVECESGLRPGCWPASDVY